MYQRPKLYSSAIPNTPKVNSPPLLVDVGNEVIVGADTRSCALSVPLSVEAEKCASSISGDCASLEPLSPDPESGTFTMQFSEDHTYCASPAPPSADPPNCTKTVAVSIDYQNSASTKPDSKDNGNSAASSLQSSLRSPIRGIDPSPMKIDVKAVQPSSLHGIFHVVNSLTIFLPIING